MGWSVTAAFAAALRRGDHEPIVRVDVLEAGEVVASSEVATARDDLLVASGGVSIDRAGEIRRQFTSRFIDTSGALVPVANGDLLDPRSGREVRVWRGLRILNPDLTTTDELVPLGTCGLERASITDTVEAITVDLSGRDRAARIAENEWTVPFIIDAGTNKADAIRLIVENRIPNMTIPFALAATDQTLTDKLVLGGGGERNGWRDARKIAESLGHEVFFGPLGECRSTPNPDPNTSPIVWSYLEDEDGLRIDPLTRTIDGTGLRNGVIVRGEAPWLLFPVSGEAWDLDSSSPTYYDPANPAASTFGPRPVVIGDALVSTDAQAAAAAAAKLPDVLGVEEQITFNAIVNLAHDGGDVIEIASAAIGAPTRFVVETLQIPLEVDAGMSGTTKRRRT